MKHIKILTFLLLITVIYSCKKDKKTEPAEAYSDDVIGVPTDASKFSQLKVGNYWIYQEFAIDSLGIVTPTSIYDSCYIEKDTLVRGKLYFKMWKPLVSGKPYAPHFIRDSADRILEADDMLQSDFISFSVTNFFTPLHTAYQFSPPDTVFKEITKMTDANLNVIVPAGVFSTLNAQHTYYFNPKYSSIPIRYRNVRYAASVGIVSETAALYLSTKNYSERRLVRYHLN